MTEKELCVGVRKSTYVLKKRTLDIILYINILVFWTSGVCVGVCGCAIPHWNRLGTHMNVCPALRRLRAPHARNWQKCVFYFISHDIMAFLRFGALK